MWSLLGNVPCALEKKVYSLTSGWNVLKISMRSISSNVSFKTCVSVFSSVQFSSVTQSCPTLYDSMNRSCQGSLSITNSWSLPKPMSIESVMPSSHFILCHALLLLSPIPPSTRSFSNESTLRMMWPKYWSFADLSIDVSGVLKSPTMLLS